MDDKLPVKTLILNVGAVANPSNSVMSGLDADLHVTGYIRQGYRIHTIQALQTNADYVVVYYFLVLDE